MREVKINEASSKKYRGWNNIYKLDDEELVAEGWDMSFMAEKISQHIKEVILEIGKQHSKKDSPLEDSRFLRNAGLWWIGSEYDKEQEVIWVYFAGHCVALIEKAPKGSTQREDKVEQYEIKKDNEEWKPLPRGKIKTHTDWMTREYLREHPDQVVHMDSAYNGKYLLRLKTGEN